MANECYKFDHRPRKLISHPQTQTAWLDLPTILGKTHCPKTYCIKLLTHLKYVVLEKTWTFNFHIERSWCSATLIHFKNNVIN